MKVHSLRVACLSGILLAPCLPSVWSQATPPAAPKEAEEAIALPQFVITEKAANPYLSRQALSASRVAMDIQDIPQTVSVVTGDFIEDTLSSRMLDAAKYVTPVVENTLPFGGDRYSMRGFQVSHEFIDGTEISGFGGYSMSLAPYNIERLEIIKGPNAILIPGGNPGGQINPITKAPIARDFTDLTLEVAQYYGNDVNFDVNRVLNTKNNMAVRLVGAYWRNEYYLRNQYRNGYLLAPSFSVQLSPAHKLILKSEFVQNRETNGVGVPIDPSIGSGASAQIARGLPRDWTFADDSSDTRHRSTQRASAELLSTLSDHITSRLYLMADHVRRYDVGSGGGGLTNAGGGSVNPFTGLYEPGISWNTTAYRNDTTGTVTLVGTPVAVTDPSTWIYSRNAGKEDIEYNEVHVKNDYAGKFEIPFAKSTTILGFAANGSKVHRRSYPSAGRPAVPANNLDSITYPAWQYPAIQPGFTTAALGLDRTGKQTDLQIFAYEMLSGWEDRVQVSGGVSRYFGNLTRADSTGTGILSTLPNSPDYDLTNNAVSFGVVIKPIKPISLFYSRNTTGGTMPDSILAGTVDPTSKLAQGGQKEYGIKTSLLNGQLTASFAYFDIAQQNVSVTNSDYYTLIAQGKFAEAAALPPTLYVSQTCKGWEFEMTYAMSKNLTLVGNYSHYKTRQPITNVRLRGIPDTSYAFYVDYRFSEQVLKGFGVNIGLDYKSDVAGDNATGFTTGTKPLPNGSFVPNQPTFNVAGRTLVNVGLTYRPNQTWTGRLQLNNALDKEYIFAAGSRGGAIVGDPRNLKASVTYSF